VPSSRFDKVLAIKPRGELSRDLHSLVEYLPNAGYSRKETAVCSMAVSICPKVLYGLLNGTISPEEAARTALEEAGLDYETCRPFSQR